MIFDLHQRKTAVVSGCLSLEKRAAKKLLEKNDGRSDRRIEFLESRCVEHPSPVASCMNDFACFK